MTEEDRVRLRHTDRWVGALVIAALAVFLVALFQRSVIREWFAAGAELTVLLPEEGGVAGLSEGSEAEVLGIRAGTVRRIVVAPEGRIRAELRIEEQAKIFIRQDSEATIRRRFGVAGPAYLDIARGQGAPLDWRHAVIEAKVEPVATETAGALLQDIRNRVYPVLDDLQRGMRSFADAAERLNRGDGTVGRLLTTDTIAKQAEEATRRAAELLESAQAAVRDVQGVTSSLSGGTPGASGQPPAGSLPALLARADRALASLEQASRDVARATPALPRATRNVAEGTQNLPAVVVQLQETARELELLLTQLRGNWLLGGAGAPAREPVRPSADRLRP
jgi:phospholipid/cholesterol/gamma-HCH transport system substrate-binding protein